MYYLSKTRLDSAYRPSYIAAINTPQQGKKGFFLRAKCYFFLLKLRYTIYFIQHREGDTGRGHFLFLFTIHVFLIQDFFLGFVSGLLPQIDYTCLFFFQIYGLIASFQIHSVVQ